MTDNEPTPYASSVVESDHLPSDTVRHQVAEHAKVIGAVVDLEDAIDTVATMLRGQFAAGGTLYTFGNGGSAADAQHLAGELIGRFRRARAPLPAVALSTDPTVTTCIANDLGFDQLLSRQVVALVRPQDVVAAFTTSGRSPNVVAGLATARERGATTLLFCGADPGPAGHHADHVLAVPSTSTPRIQEAHTLLLHVLSENLDAWAAGRDREGGAT